MEEGVNKGPSGGTGVSCVHKLVRPHFVGQNEAASDNVSARHPRPACLIDLVK
jgi:hypothetical protein